MKITRRNESVKVLFSTIQPGTCFIDDGGRVCMKIDEVVSDQEEHLNAVVLAFGEVGNFDPDLYVKVVNAELIVEG